MKRLRIPAALAVTVVEIAVGATVGCGDHKPHTDASTCPVACVESPDQGIVCAAQPCVDDHGACPPGCEPEPVI